MRFKRETITDDYHGNTCIHFKHITYVNHYDALQHPRLQHTLKIFLTYISLLHSSTEVYSNIAFY